jgi:hypothetical protein
LDYYGTTEQYINLFFSKDPPNIAAPVTTARPAATGDEWSHLNQTILVGSNAFARIATMTAVRATDGSFFIAGACPYSGGEYGQYFRALYMLNVVKSPKAWDPAGAVTLVKTDKGLTGWYYEAIDFQTLHSDGSQVTVNPIYLDNVSQPTTWRHTCPWSGDHATTPVWLVSSTAAKKCFRGYLEDVFWASPQLADGMLLFKNQVVKAVKVGAFTCPMDRATGLI